MKRMIAILVYIFLFASTPSYGEMMEQMKDMEHMKEHMGKTMESMEGKEVEGDFTKEAEAGEVTVNVTYRNPGERKDPEFTVKLDTHSVELDQYDLEAVTILRDDTGGEYTAGLVSASGSGHHREVVLSFKDADLSTASSVELVIRGVAGIEQRVFRFELRKEMMGQ